MAPTARIQVRGPLGPCPQLSQRGPFLGGGLDIFLPLARLGLRVCCFSASSGLDFLTIKMSVFAVDPEVPPHPHRLRSLTLSGCIWEATMPQSQGLSFPLEPRGARRCRKLSPSALPLPPHHPSPRWGGGPEVLSPQPPGSSHRGAFAPGRAGIGLCPRGPPGRSVSRVEFQPFGLGKMFTGPALGNGPVIAPLSEDMAGVIRF